MKPLTYHIYKGLFLSGIVPPKVIVQIDGGICSQMHQYLLGTFYRNKGYNVCFDPTFFKERGNDLNEEFVRNFDLLKVFPYLPYHTILSKAEVFFYKHKFYYEGNNTNLRTNNFGFLDKKPPIYLGGYYHLPPSIWLQLFQSLFHIDPSILCNTDKHLFDCIKKQTCPIAVHVRRGDLKVEIYGYGKPASIDYFQKAIIYCNEHFKTPYFYFYSDEPQWVKENLIPTLTLQNNYKIIDFNGSDKGYIDLLLIAACKHQITSKGTLGKYGALLDDNEEKTVILYNDEIEQHWKPLLKNPVYL